MVISWPKRITDKGGLRSQFLHLIDIAPTILDVAGIPQPQVVNGVTQKPIEGVSFVSTFDSAAAPEVRTAAVFRDDGQPGDLQGRLDRGDAPRHPMDDRRPGDRLRQPTCGNSTTSSKDFTEANDLAAQNPAKLKELQAAFDVEARKYNVFPLDDRFAQRVDLTNRPNPLAGLTSFTYGPGVSLHRPERHTEHEQRAVHDHGGNRRRRPVGQTASSPPSAEDVRMVAVHQGRAADLLLQLLRGGGIPRAVLHAASQGEEHSARRVHARRAGVRKARGRQAVREWKADGRRPREKDGSGGVQREGLDIGMDNISAVSPRLQVAVRIRRHDPRRDDRSTEISNVWQKSDGT